MFPCVILLEINEIPRNRAEAYQFFANNTRAKGQKSENPRRQPLDSRRFYGKILLNGLKARRRHQPARLR
ncbi:MAG TPA: hypothetical protein DEB39_02540 [Planctomycetaceae bacterium]|nr:hypothetical protein [Planctomycetaceae bacterium]